MLRHRWINFLGVAICSAILTSTVVVADESGEDSADGLQRFDARSKTCRMISDQDLIAGYRNFQTLCKSCHSKKHDQGAPFIYTESKTRRGWDRVFDKMYPACARNGSWDRFETEELLKVHDYLFANAAGTYDSRCGA